MARLTVRQFSAPAAMVSQLVTHPLHNDTRDEVAYYTVTNLAPDTGYTGTVLYCTVYFTRIQGSAVANDTEHWIYDEMMMSRRYDEDVG